MQSNSIEHSSIETVSRESNALSANSISSSAFSPFIHIPSTGILAFSLIFLSLSSSFPSLLSSSSTWHRIPSNQSLFTGIYSCIRSTNHLLLLLLSSHSNFFHYNQLSSSFHHLCLFCVSSFPFLFLLLFLCSTNQLLILNDDASLSLSSFSLNDDALSSTNNLFYFHSNHILSL